MSPRSLSFDSDEFGRPGDSWPLAMQPAPRLAPDLFAPQQEERPLEEPRWAPPLEDLLEARQTTWEDAPQAIARGYLRALYLSAERQKRRPISLCREGPLPEGLDPEVAAGLILSVYNNVLECAWQQAPAPRRQLQLRRLEVPGSLPNGRRVRSPPCCGALLIGPILVNRFLSDPRLTAR